MLDSREERYFLDQVLHEMRYQIQINRAEQDASYHRIEQALGELNGKIDALTEEVASLRKIPVDEVAKKGGTRFSTINE